MGSDKFDDFSVRLVLKSDELIERFELWLKSLWARQRGYSDSAGRWFSRCSDKKPCKYCTRIQEAMSR